ncbi:CiV14g2-like-2 protein [Chelonus insularis]|nr:CiV14g2-like-2 protein [Chelonus insularis]
MAKLEKEACGSSSKANTTDDKNNTSATSSSHSKGFNPHNMFWAIKYNNNIPEKIVILHFDEFIMEVLELNQKESK